MTFTIFRVETRGPGIIVERESHLHLHPGIQVSSSVLRTLILCQYPRSALPSVFKRLLQCETALVLVEVWRWWRWRPSYLLGGQTELCYFYLLGQAGPRLEPNNTQLSSPHSSLLTTTPRQSGAHRNGGHSARIFKTLDLYWKYFQSQLFFLSHWKDILHI